MSSLLIGVPIPWFPASAVGLALGVIIGGTIFLVTGCWPGGGDLSDAALMRHWRHACVLLGGLPLATLATVFFSSGPQSLINSLESLSDGAVRSVPIIGPWMAYLDRAGNTAASFDFVRDILAVNLVIFFAYFGNVVMRQLIVTSRLLKLGRRAQFHNLAGGIRKR
jgi:hypothetical protein